MDNFIKNKYEASQKRKLRIRARLRRKNAFTPRLSISRSSKHIYAQIIDDTKGITIAAASDMEKGASYKSKIEAAEAVGKAIAERAKEKGVETVIFDRGSYLFHGRVKALADSARSGGLNF
ncbi:MAG: 50S ribosomal protein L18 [Chlamydiia bacterium]|nr:50S ribosomal protein L18 [Chlamydiia bacterium]